MPDTDTLTVRLPLETKRRLGRLADRTKRTRSFLAAEAITDYVSRELEIVAGIERGLADMKAGRVVPHAKAMALLRASVKAAAKGKRKR